MESTDPGPGLSPCSSHHSSTTLSTKPSPAFRKVKLTAEVTIEAFPTEPPPLGSSASASRLATCVFRATCSDWNEASPQSAVPATPDSRTERGKTSSCQKKESSRRSRRSKSSRLFQPRQAARGRFWPGCAVACCTVVWPCCYLAV